MKTKRFLLAAALAFAAAACSGDVTAPDPAVRAPAAGALTDESQTGPTAPVVVEPVEEDGGHLGSGVGK